MTYKTHKISKIAYQIISWPLFSKYATVKAIGRLKNTGEFQILKTDLEG